LKHTFEANKLAVSVRVVLVEPGVEGNIGFLARAMKNFGLRELCLVEPKVGVGAVARAFAMHARDILDQAISVDSINEAVKDADFIVGTTAVTAKRALNVKRTPITPAEFAKAFSSIKGKVALLFGREGSGLTNDEIDKCDFIISIPTDSTYPTMNITHAATILFYELYKATRKGKAKHVTEASGAQKERLIKYFTNLVKETGPPNHKRRIALRSFRNVLGRSFVSSREATTLMGVYKRALQRIRGREKGKQQSLSRRTRKQR